MFVSSVRSSRLNQFVWLFFKEMRPHQWTKNVLIFSALLFSLQKTTLWDIVRLITGFVLFCIVAGCVYLFNDYLDREVDRNHPEKRKRPLASGHLNADLALMTGLVLFLMALTFAFCLDVYFFCILLGYFILNVAYSMKFKHVVIVDLMIIAAGFVMRAVAGGVIMKITITPWFLMCILLLSLFLAIGKRRQELHLLEKGAEHRKVLKHYSVPLLDQLNSIVTTATIISYSLFTFTSGRTPYLMLTIPFVIFGIFRYLYLIHMEDRGGSPDKILLEDKPILITVILYTIAVVLILLLFE